MHAAMSFGKHARQSNTNNLARRNELTGHWEGVDFLFVDEYSMIGCSMLCDISKALSVAKEDKRPFGGINIIFAGDFAQLPTIGQSKLYSVPVKKPTHNADTTDRNLLGRLLWLSVDKVINLMEIMRKRSVDAKGNTFLDLLGRLREG